MELSFGQNIRTEQGNFRDISNTISDMARTPDDDKGKRHKHLLALDHEIENLYPGIRDEEQVLEFFSKRGIKWWKSTRSGDNTKRSGPTRNMASSQIFCVNYWYPIKDNREILTGILRFIDPTVEEVTEIESYNIDCKEKLTSLVEFEWVGSKTTLEKKKYTRGANATSIDAFIKGISRDKRIGFFFEWKMVEEYRENNLGTGRSGQTRRDTYSQYIHSENSVFSKKIPLDAVLFEPFYQIFRMGLLGQKSIYEDKELDKVYVILVYPRGNVAYSERITSQWLRDHFLHYKTISEITKEFFIPPVEYIPMFAEDLWNITKYNISNARYADWVNYMSSRYFVSF